MQGKTRYAAFAVAMLLSIPLASADWRGRGYYEPDTWEDKVDGFMHLDPDANPDPNHRQAYLSVWAHQDHHSVNPNSAELGSSVMPYPTRMHAILGVWKDCNGDGYIGMPEGLFAWYPSTLLDSGSTTCPPQRVLYGLPNPEVAHNDGTWVREFFPIGPRGSNEFDYLFDVNDDTAQIWGDWGLPDEGPLPTCPVSPLPRGTWQSTGGFLRYVDCHPHWRISDAINAAANATGLQVIGFNDAQKERPDQSESALNQDNPWGREGDESYVTAFDCKKEPAAAYEPTGQQRQVVIEDDPTGIDEATGLSIWHSGLVAGEDGVLYVNATDRDGRIANLTWQPATPAVNPDGSPAGTVNETTEAVYWGRAWSGTMGSCDREDDTGGFYSGDVYPTLLETDHEGQSGPRSQTDFYFSYTSSNSTGCQTGLAASCAPRAWHLLGNGPQLGYAVAWPTGSTGVWFGNPSYTASRNPIVNRITLEPYGASYVTFYATIAQTTWTPGAVGTYGSNHCNGLQPKTGLWECDGERWWLDPNGKQVKANNQVTVGQPYSLRDVDCYDHDLTNKDADPGVLTQVGERQCRR